MHRTEHSRFRKTHDFVADFSQPERRMRIMIGTTAAMMFVEIVGGLMSQSVTIETHRCRENHASVASA
jgi:Co/Zn/Cd efflux system component